MSVVINLPAERINVLSNPLTALGYSHKIVVRAQDIAVDCTNYLYVALLTTPKLWSIERGFIWGVREFTPDIFVGAPELTNDTTVNKTYITQFSAGSTESISSNNPIKNSGISSTTLYLRLHSNGSNFNTLTDGEIWIFLSLLDIKKMGQN